MSEIIDLVQEVLESAPELAGIKEWLQASNLISLGASGGTIGIEKETYEPYDREYDEATVYLNIIIWIKNADPVAGEAEVRRLARAARKVLCNDRTLGGAVEESYVKDIEYAAADTGKSLLLHLAAIDYQVTYYAERLADEEASEPIESIDHDLDNW